MVNMDAFHISVLLIASLIPDYATSANELQTIGESSNRFAVDVYQVLRETSPNIVVSPLCLQIVLAMAQQGAQGTTATEMVKVLHHSANNGRIMDGYRALIAELQRPFLKIATKMFVESSFDINPHFQNTLTKYFMSELEGVNFKFNPEDSKRKINEWVENKTNHTIKNLLTESIDPQTKLILANALHIKADWLKIFNKKYTEDTPFYVTSNHSVNVKMMFDRGSKFNYMFSQKLGNSHIVEMKYKIKPYRMIIILPKRNDGLEELESKLDSSILSEELSKLREMKVDLGVPRFKLEETMNMENILMKLGMLSAFGGQADFSGMSDEHLRLSKVVQKAFIDVNEEGTEAGAATETLSTTLSLPRTVTCNHPFIYMILKGNTILFIGRLSHPLDQQKDENKAKAFARKKKVYS